MCCAMIICAVQCYTDEQNGNSEDIMARKTNTTPRQTNTTFPNSINHADIEPLIAKKIDQRRIRQMALSLQSSLGISNGNHLVYLFGQGDKRDNFEALTGWVSVSLPTFSDYSTSEQFALVRTDLARHLEAACNSCFDY